MKEGFRQSMAWLHNWSGLLIGWLLFAIALTGTAAVFRPETSNWMRPEIAHHAGPVDQAQALGAAVSYLSSAGKGAPAWYLTAPDDRAAFTQAIFSLPRGGDANGYRTLALDPRTGRPDGIRDTLGGEFFYRFHFELKIPYPWGRILASAAAMVMLVALISGIITHRRIFADFFTLRPRKGQRSWLDVHNALGVLALPFHLMITFTGIMTLITLTMPWAIVANYGSDMARFYEDMAPGFSARPALGKAAPLGDVAAMVRDARRRMDGQISLVIINNPGDAAATVTISKHDDGQIAYAAGRVTYDGVSGRLLSAYAEDRPMRKLYDTFYGLHVGRFGAPVTRWLYFICGLALTATIGSGLVLWTVKRSRNGGLGYHLVEKLNIGVVTGLPVAAAAFLWANRLLPVTMAQRPEGEVRVFFTSWVLMILAGFILPRRIGWIAGLMLCAAAWLLLPPLSAWTTGRGMITSLLAGDWQFFGFDTVSLAIGLMFAIACRHMVRPAPAARVPRRMQAA